MASGSQIVALFDQGADPDEAVLDRVFFALSDPVRRAILERLDGEVLLVSAVAVWINRYSKYWQEQFDLLAAMLEEEVSEPRRRKPRAGSRRGKIGRKV